MMLFEIIQEVRIETAVSRKSRSFNQLMKVDEVKKSDLIKLISGLIFRIINQAYNIPENLNEFQSTMMAARLMTNEEMGIEDAVLIVKKGVFGEFGRIYNKFDLDTWDEWISKYLDQRINERERQYNESKKTSGSPTRDSRVKEMTDKMLRKGKIVPDEKYFNKDVRKKEKVVG